MMKTKHINFLRALKRKLGSCRFDTPITFIAQGEYEAITWAIEQLSQKQEKVKDE